MNSSQPNDHEQRIGTTGNDRDLLALAMEKYLERIESGDAVSPVSFASQFPEIADELVTCLESVRLMHAVGPSVGSLDATEPTNANRQIGDYHILREIGRGGMGVVYEAEEQSMARRVALKVLPFAALLDDRQLKRFKNEARAAGALHHPHIVPVFSIGTERGVHYYAMQFVDGPSLAEVLQDLEHGTNPHEPRNAHSEVPDVIRPVSETRRDIQAALTTQRSSSRVQYCRSVAQWGLEAAEALGYAHENGVLHRDIKPGNLLLDRNGKLLVTDFGLARLETDASITVSGDIVGTLRYMAPEQALGKRVLIDQRADIYSLGVTLYELATMKPAFSGTDREELLHKVAFHEPVAPTSLDSSIPRDLETIILKALSKAPEDRYQEALDLGDDLQRFLQHQPVAAKRPSLLDRARKWTRRHQAVAWTAALLLLVLCLTTTVGLAWSRHKNKQLANAMSQQQVALAGERAAKDEKQRALTETRSAERQAQRNHYLSAMRQAYHDYQLGDTSRVAESIVRFIPQPGKEDFRRWEWYHLQRLLDESSQVLPQTASPLDVAWHPNGKYLAAACGDVIRLWDPQTWSLVATFGPDAADSIAWHPDGELLAATHVDKGIRVWNILSGEVVHEVSASRARSITYSRDGKRIAAAVGDSAWKVWDAETFRELWSHQQPGARAVSWSPDGARLACFTSSSKQDLVSPSQPQNIDRVTNTISMFQVFDIDQDELVGQATDFEGDLLDVQWSPDGDRIATREPGRTVKIFDTERFEILRSAEFSSTGDRIFWSPDGARIAVPVGRDLEIYDRHLNLQEKRFGHWNDVVSAAWLFDGESIATAALDDTVRVWRLDRPRNTTGAETVCAEIAESVGRTASQTDHAFFSKTGQLFAILDYANDRVVVRRSSNGSLVQRLAADLDISTGSVAWSADDSRIAVPTSGEQEITIFTIVDGTQKTLTRIDTGKIRSVDWQPTGSRLAAAIEPKDDREGIIKIWDVQTGELHATFRSEGDRFRQFGPVGRKRLISVAWDPSGTRIAAVGSFGGFSAFLQILNASDGDVSHTLSGHVRHRGVSKPEWSRDGRRIAAFSWDGRLSIWDTKSGDQINRLRGHTNAVGGIWLHDDQRLLSYSDDGTVRLWDAGSGEELFRFNEHYTSAALTADGSHLYLLGKTLDSIAAKSRQTSTQAKLIEYAASILIRNEKLDEAEKLIASLEPGSVEKHNLQRQLFNETYHLAESSVSALDGSSATHIRRLLAVWQQLVAQNIAAHPVREHGMVANERATHLLMQGVDLGVLRAVCYGNESVQEYMPIVDEVVREVENYVSESTLSDEAKHELSRHLHWLNKHIEGLVTSAQPQETEDDSK